MGAGEGVATNFLSDGLKMLEAHGILKSRKYEQNKTMKYYTLDNKGIELIPLLIELWAWGAKHDPQTVVNPELVAQRQANKEAIIQQIADNARQAG